MRTAVLALGVVALAACGGSTATPGPASHSRTTPTAAATSFPSPSPGGPTTPQPAGVTCTSQIPTGHELALVTLRNTAGIVVRDITDIAHPITRCVIKGGEFLRFVNGTHISYIVTGTNGAGALYMVDLQTQVTSLVRSWPNGGSLWWVYAWSSDGSMLSYLSSDGDKVAWHLLSAAGDRTLSQLGSAPGRGIDPRNDDAMVGFSADGKYVALEQTFITSPVLPFLIVRLDDHKLVFSRNAATMATWSGAGASFYYRTTQGVEAWDATTKTTRVVVPQGLAWIHPWPSADGQRIAYVDANAAGNHYAGYLRLADAQAFRLSELPRVGAAFLNPTLIWYAEESVCSAQVQCSMGGPPLTGRTFIYDLVTKTENASIITGVFESWPRVGAS